MCYIDLKGFKIIKYLPWSGKRSASHMFSNHSEINAEAFARVDVDNST